MKRSSATMIFAILAGAAASPAIAQNESATRAGQQTAPKPKIGPVQLQAQNGEPKITVSKQAAKAYKELAAAIQANDTANIPAKIAAAQAAVSTNDDRYAVAQLRLSAAVRANDNDSAIAALNDMAATNVVGNGELARKYLALGAKLYNAKDYARAASMFDRSAALNPRDVEPLNLLADARAAQGQPAAAVATLAKSLQLSAATGSKAEENTYKRAVSIAYEAKLPAAIGLGQQWLDAYPSADSWHNAVAIYRNMNHPDVATTLDLLRVLRAAKALTTPGEYGLYARAAAELNQFGEAQAVIDEGIAAKVVNPAGPEFRDIVAGLKSKPKATAADLAVAAKTAVRPALLIGIGDRYAALGDYAAAVNVYKDAIAKGGDKDLANLHIGMALARSGDKAGALAALAAAGGSQAAIAKFWTIYASHLA